MNTGPAKPPDHEVPLPGLLLLAVALAAIIFLCPLLLASKIPLLDPDEGLHASIAQEMASGGDWLVPRLMGIIPILSILVLCPPILVPRFWRRTNGACPLFPRDSVRQ